MIDAIGAEINLETGERAQAPSALAPVITRLDLALGRLEQAWRKSHLGLSARFNEKEQRTEQHIQTLRVQASHWKGEAEKLSTKLAHQDHFEQRAKKAEQELAYQRTRAQQWQEKAESWKEEARRSEEARVAALHNTSNPQIKQITQQIDSCLDEAITSLKQVAAYRQPLKQAVGGNE
jgi:chromosome segregation ATPase